MQLVLKFLIYLEVNNLTDKNMYHWDGFISTYVELMKGITDAPTLFQEFAALYLISACCGRNFQFFSLPDVNIFGNDNPKQKGKLLNLWIIILGKTRISRKSSGVLNHIKHLSDNLKLNLLPQSFSPEYLITEMSQLEEDEQVTAGLILDECSGFFDQLSKPTYMVTADTILSSLYDGQTFQRGTHSRGKEYVPNPYLTMIWASTDYLPKLFTEKMIRQGFLNRFMIIVVNDIAFRKNLRIRPLTTKEKEMIKNIQSFLAALKQNKESISITMTKKAKKSYENFETKLESRIANDDNNKLGLMEGYFGALPNFTIRIACLCRLSRMHPDEIKNYHRSLLAIKYKDMQRAFKYTKVIWKKFLLAMKLRNAGEDEEIVIVERYERKIIAVFKQSGLRTLPQNELRRRTKICTRQLEKVLDGIAEWEKGESRGGRPPLLWTLNDSTLKEYGLEHLS